MPSYPNGNAPGAPQAGENSRLFRRLMALTAARSAADAGTNAAPIRCRKRLKHGVAAMALFSHRNRSIDLHDEIADLRRQIAALARSASKRGTSAYHDTREEAAGLYDEIGDRIASALPTIRRRTRDIEDTIREHPAQTAAVLGLAALLVAAVCMLGRGGDR